MVRVKRNDPSIHGKNVTLDQMRRVGPQVAVAGAPGAFRREARVRHADEAGLAGDAGLAAVGGRDRGCKRRKKKGPERGLSFNHLGSVVRRRRRRGRRVVRGRRRRRCAHADRGRGADQPRRRCSAGRAGGAGRSAARASGGAASRACARRRPRRPCW